MNDHPSTFDPDDPRLTAYALGELTDPADLAAVEQTLQVSPQAREALREIREITAALSAEYEQERRAAGEAPRNIITLTPRPRRSVWPGLLLAAAMLLLIASVAGLVVQRRLAGPSAVFSITRPLSRASRQTPVAQGRIAVLPSPAFAGKVAAAATPTVDAPVALAQTVPAFGLADAQAGKSSLAPLPLDAAKPAPALDASVALESHDALAAAPASPPLFASAKDGIADSGAVTRRGIAGTDLPDASSITVDQNRTDAYGSVDRDFMAGRGSALSISGVDAPARAPSKTLLVQKELNAVGGVAAAAAAAITLANPADSRYAVAATDRRETSRAPGLEPLPAGPNTAVYEHRTENPFLAAKDNPLSTLSIDVDTASYANVRRFIESGRLPPTDAVRIEELVNYFPYNYAPPAPGDEHPFAVNLEAASCPWNPQDRLVRIGIKGRELARDKRPPSNLVFLLDVSGSMAPPERLPLIKAAMRLLVEQLREDDHVAVVTYAGESGVALPSATGDQKDRILRVIDALRAGGSTNGAAGIKLAYQVAREGFIQGGTNRVILATDGDFNVGVTSRDELVRMIETEAKSGVALSALGVGTDNYKDATMQKLADKGNGNYHYIDKLDEARKVLVEQMSGTLVTIARDVKIQVEFNPATVAAYRLIGYEKRMLRKEDFNDDRVDAGEIGAGHCVTALYEVVPAGQAVPLTTPVVDALKYAGTPAPTPQPDVAVARDVATATPSRELLTVKLRHKAPDGDANERSYEEALTDHGVPGDFSRASADFKFAAAVADFGLALRDSPNKGGATFGAAIELAQEGIGADPGGYRAGFIELARRAETIQREHGE